MRKLCATSKPLFYLELEKFEGFFGRIVEEVRVSSFIKNPEERKSDSP